MMQASLQPTADADECDLEADSFESEPDFLLAPLRTSSRGTCQETAENAAPPKHPASPRLPRLVSRNLPFDQSRNKINIRHNLQRTLSWKLCRLLCNDWFHAWLRLPTVLSILMLVTIWTCNILLFALIYVYIDHLQPGQACGLGAAGFPIKFAGAFAFSLETCATVGYGLPNGVNAFFDASCGGLQAAIYLQMLWSMLFNAFLLGFLFNRLGRSEARGVQVVHSRQAIVSLVNNRQLRFQVRLYDLDARHPVVEAHVRLYAVTHARPVPRPLRILQPNDELGATLLLSFPTTVAHAVDAYSLLYPSSADNTTMVDPAGLILRQVDAMTGSRDDYVCHICGENFGTWTRYKAHVRYQQIVERQDNFPVRGTHLSVSNFSLDNEQDDADKDLVKPQQHEDNMMEQLRQHFQQEIAEIICVVEGIDPLTSGTFQSLHSYRYEDVVFAQQAQFAPCLQVVTSSTTTNNRGNDHDNDDNSSTTTTVVQMDMDRFHQILVMDGGNGNDNTAASIATAAAGDTNGSKSKNSRQKSRRPADSLFSSMRGMKPTLATTTTTTTTTLNTTSSTTTAAIVETMTANNVGCNPGAQQGTIGTMDFVREQKQQLQQLQPQRQFGAMTV